MLKTVIKKTVIKNRHPTTSLFSLLHFQNCTVGQKKKEKRNTRIYFNTNYHTEMKLAPIIMDYCLLQFDALKFFFVLHVHGGVST